MHYLQIITLTLICIISSFSRSIREDSLNKISALGVILRPTLERPMRCVQISYHKINCTQRIQSWTISCKMPATWVWARTRQWLETYGESQRQDFAQVSILQRRDLLLLYSFLYLTLRHDWKNLWLTHKDIRNIELHKNLNIKKKRFHSSRAKLTVVYMMVSYQRMRLIFSDPCYVYQFFPGRNYICKW